LAEAISIDGIENVVLRPEMIPCQYGFWWFPRPINLPLWDGDTTHMRAALWSSDPNAGIEIATYHHFWSLRNGIDSFGSFVWGYGESMADALNGVPCSFRNSNHDEINQQIANDDWHVAALKRIAALFLFMEQRILITPQHRAERHTRKRLERNGWQHEPLVRVVELRRKQAKSQHDGEHEAIDWSHQWIVSGHWRQQWYPSLNANQPRWIMPYVKGPEDKPLKPPRAKVFAVVR
jgi:hypothetical protein